MKRAFIAGAALLLSTSALADECGNASTQVEMKHLHRATVSGGG
ncbi:Uncharacterised protein [Leclercia adecarboxylata]|uniref:Uncharacterized protein n=1 Tax=Leclercia adecarboxylata TaxID=83655 RepID=A0A4U9HS36_9ENTR|nr:Uncharacterised protein [Leclercia adecarboxylata]